MQTETITTRRDEVKPGNIFKSSHGYRLLVTEVIDTAEFRGDDRIVQINGHLHADPSNMIRCERYPAESTVEVEIVPNPVLDALLKDIEDARDEAKGADRDVQLGIARMRRYLDEIETAVAEERRFSGSVSGVTHAESEMIELARILSRRQQAWNIVAAREGTARRISALAVS